MGKSIEVAKTLLEEMASKNYHRSSEKATLRRSGGKHDVDVMTLLASRMDTLTQRLDRVGTSPTPGGPLGPSIEVYAICETYGVQGHTFIECYNGPPTSEHANIVHNFNPPPQRNPYRNTHSSGWRSYSNHSYKNSNTQPQSSMPALGYQYKAPTTPSPPPPPQCKSSLESLMDQFIATQTNTNETLSASIYKVTFKFDAMVSHQKAMDT